MTRLPAPVPALLAAAALLATAPPALAQGYPRVGLYGVMDNNGYPFTFGGTRFGPLDAAMCDSIARFDEVVLDASPISEYRPDIAAELRRRNPDIRLLALALGHGIFGGRETDSLRHFQTRYRRLVRNLDADLHRKGGGIYLYGGGNVNLARQDAGGRYVFAESLAVLLHDAIIRPGIWDGLFLDVFCDRFAWTQTPGESIDFQRCGYPTLAAFDDGWQAASDTLAQRLRRLAGESFLLVGNCGQGTQYATFNGWMRENFPFQNGGDWYQNMFRAPGGYFTDEAEFRPPRHNYIFSAAEPIIAPYSADNNRRVRWGLGSASLGEGYGVFGNSSRTLVDGNYMTWWYDEFAVERATGRASPRLEHTGWLGEARGTANQMIWVGPGPDAVTNPEFETDVTSGWVFTPGAPATIARDPVAAASGGASARVSVPAAADYEWRVNLATTGRLAMTAGQEYAVTFWAKASPPRLLPVSAIVPGGGSLITARVAVDSVWRRHQVVLRPQGSGSAALVFFLSGAAGEVWLDDVHFQPGVTSLWRRDFEHGIVLVNPSERALTVPLGRPFRRILGTSDPAVNDGATASSVTVGAQDALFLLGDDHLPPAAVRDLRPVPY